MDLVSRETLYKYVASLEETYRNELLEIPAEHPCFTAQNKLLNTVSMIKFAIADASTVEAVPKGAYEQVKWERDMAIQQLNDYGVQLGEKVDIQAVRHGHNENREYHEVDEFRCSECGLHLEDWTRYVYDEDSDEKYAQEYVFKRCPECGAKIGVQ